MPKMPASKAWYDEIEQEQKRSGEHWRAVELALFIRICRAMREEGASYNDIRRHFEETYGIKRGAFYSRLRRAGHVKPMW